MAASPFYRRGRGSRVKINPLHLVYLAGGAAAVYFGYRAYKRGAGIVDSAVQGVKQTVAQAAAQVEHVTNTVANNFERGQAYMRGETVPLTDRQILNSDYGYAGIDPATGRRVDEGEFYSDPEALRYEYEQRQAGYAPAATSIDGAAFGVYPNALPKVFASTTINHAARREAWLLDQALARQQESTGGATGSW